MRAIQPMINVAAIMLVVPVMMVFEWLLEKVRGLLRLHATVITE